MSELCTNAIVVASGNECKVLAEDCEDEFNVVDVKDPELGIVEFLENEGSCFIEDIVVTMKHMENALSKDETIPMEYTGIASKLWGLSRNLAQHRAEFEHDLSDAMIYMEKGNAIFKF